MSQNESNFMMTGWMQGTNATPWFGTYALPIAVGAVLAAVLLAGFWFGRKKDAAHVPVWMTLARAIRGPLTFVAAVVTAISVERLLPVSPALLAGIHQALVLSLISGLTWLVIRAVGGIEQAVIKKHDISAEDNLRARHVQTQVRVLSRTVQIVLFLLGAGGAIMTFESVREFGVSILASAGIAGIAVGLAAKPILENLLAGIQIALTQPIRIDDALIVEGEWGWVEEIAATYVVVRIWDDRRLIVPLRYFIDTPFQNWTRTTSKLLGTVFVYCDYHTDVDAVREELKRICENSPKWDRRLAIVQVTDMTQQSVQLRALVSAGSGPKLWDLRVEVREGLVKFLRQNEDSAVPRVRASLSAPVSVISQASGTENGQVSGLLDGGPGHGPGGASGPGGFDGAGSKAAGAGRSGRGQ